MPLCSIQVMYVVVQRYHRCMLISIQNLKSAEEMEEEEKAAQSAKLQELIRRGGPEDLQEANRLMKVMAGYDTRHKTDYRAKAAEEVSRVQQKAKLLEEMLQGHKQGDKVGEGDVFEVNLHFHVPCGTVLTSVQELANALQSAHPKIQRMCEEESDDAVAVAKLLEINDSIHRTVERYKLVRKGDIEGAAKIPQGTLGTSTGVVKNANNELSLIDFGGDSEPATAGSSEPATSSEPLKATSGEDDLLGLSLEDKPYGQSGGIALGFGANTSTSPEVSMDQPNVSQIFLAQLCFPPMCNRVVQRGQQIRHFRNTLSKISPGNQITMRLPLSHNRLRSKDLFHSQRHQRQFFSSKGKCRRQPRPRM